MGNPIAATRRLSGLQEVFANEVANEAEGLGEAKPHGKRNARGNRQTGRIGYSDDPVKAFGTVSGRASKEMMERSGGQVGKCFRISRDLTVGV